MFALSGPTGRTLSFIAQRDGGGRPAWRDARAARSPGRRERKLVVEGPDFAHGEIRVDGLQLAAEGVPQRGRVDAGSREDRHPWARLLAERMATASGSVRWPLWR